MASRKSPAVLAISAIFLLLVHGAHSFYLPGVTPQDFLKGDRLKVKVNTLTSTKTQLPYSYYSLPYCQPERIVNSIENLGEVLRGDRIENSPYVFSMQEPQMCNIVCRIIPNAKIVKELKEKIDDEYRVNMILDNLPLVVPIQRLYQKALTVYQLGFHVGLKGRYAGIKEEKYFIHNHLAFTVKYRRDLPTGTARIVGFEVKPFSVKHEYEGEWNDMTRSTTCNPHSKHFVVNYNSPQEIAENQEIIYAYDVEFQESDVKWASRWDASLQMSDDQIHWFSIVNSLIIVLFLSGTIMTISKDRVKPSPQPDSWKLREIFATGIVLGGYLALMTVVFFWLMNDTDFFSDKFHVRSLRDRPEQMMAALYLQVSTVSQALIFITRSRSWSFVERPGLLLFGAFMIAQLASGVAYAEGSC